MIKTYYLAKILSKLNIPSFRDCDIDRTAKVDRGCTLTRVKLGRCSYFAHHVNATDAVFGSFCSVGAYCSIGGGEHPTDMVSTSPVFLRGKNFLRRNYGDLAFPKSEPVRIGSDVWIGSHAFIRPGVTIGDGAVIGAHAVVTHDVAPYAVVAGVPAQEMRKRFDDETVRRLLAARWWDLPDERLRELAPRFGNVSLFLQEIER